MQQLRKSSFILGVLFVVVFSNLFAAFQPVQAANNDVAKDKDRLLIKSVSDCMQSKFIDEDDDIDNFSDMFDDEGRQENIVVGFSIDGENGTINCLTAVRKGLVAMGVAKDTAAAEKYFIEYITGEKFISGQKIKNDSDKMLSNAAKLKSSADSAYKKIGEPSDAIKRSQLAKLVSTCFTGDKGGGSDYNEGRGDFKVSGLGTFQQKDNIKWKQLSWIKPNDGFTSQTRPEIGDIELAFANGTDTIGFAGGTWQQNNTDGSSDFYPFRSDISQTSAYTRDSIVDCHFVKKNKDWIFKGAKINSDGTVTLAGINGEQTDGGDTDGKDVAGEAEEPSCEVNGTNPLSWGICPIINGMGDLVDWIFDSFIYPLLETPPLVVKPDSGMFKVWSGFRLIANIVLVIVFLVMIFGQAIGGGLVDAYTVKKVMPRVVIGAIGINLSIYLSAILIDITNVVGNGLGALITAPFTAGGGNQYKPGALSGAIPLVIIALTAGAGVFMVKRYNKWTSAGAGGGHSLRSLTDIRKSVYGQWIGNALIWALLFIGLPVAIATISIFVTLILRTGIILLCAVTAPVAIALWILPNTEQYFKKWWGLFTKALLVYPIIVVLFAMGDVLAYAFGGDLMSPNAKFGINGVIAIFAQFLPLFMIGYAFKIAGGLLGSIQETISKRGKQGAEFIKGNENDHNSLRNRTKRNLSDSTTRARADIYRQRNQPGWAGKLSRRIGGGGRILEREAAINAAALDRRNKVKDTGDDSIGNALVSVPLYNPDGSRKLDKHGNMLRKTLDGKKEVTEADYEEAKKVYPNNGDKQMWAEYRAGKTVTDDDFHEFNKNWATYAEQEGLEATTEANPMYKGLGFMQQQNRLEAKGYKFGLYNTNADGSFHSAFDPDSSTPLPAGVSTTYGLLPAEHPEMHGADTDLVEELYHAKDTFTASRFRGSTFQRVGEIKRHDIQQIQDISRQLDAGVADPAQEDALRARLGEHVQRLEKVEGFEAAMQTTSRSIVDEDGNMVEGGSITSASAGTQEAFRQMKAVNEEVLHGPGLPPGIDPATGRPTPGSANMPAQKIVDTADVRNRYGLPGGRPTSPPPAAPVPIVRPPAPAAPPPGPAPRGGERPGDITAGVAGLSGGRATPPPARPPGAPVGLGDDDPGDAGPIGG